MTHQSERTLELDPEMAVALRDWLVTLSQRLGLDAATAADVPTPPTTTSPEQIAPYLGELALLLEASGCPDPDTATVRINVASEPAVENSPGVIPESQRNVLDDRDEAFDSNPALDDSDPCSLDPESHHDVELESVDTAMPERGYYVDPEHDSADYNLDIHAPLDEAIWRATPTQSTRSGVDSSSLSEEAVADMESNGTESDE